MDIRKGRERRGNGKAIRMTVIVSPLPLSILARYSGVLLSSARCPPFPNQPCNEMTQYCKVGNTIEILYIRLFVYHFSQLLSLPLCRGSSSGRGGWSLALLTFSLERMPLQARHARSEASGGGGRRASSSRRRRRRRARISF